MELIEYIQSLNVKKSYHINETIFHISDNCYITIEFYENVFFVDDSKKYHKDKYTHITKIEELNKIYSLITSKDISHLLRKYKLKKLSIV
jgi:diphthamide synthase subunit DPH2